MVKKILLDNWEDVSLLLLVVMQYELGFLSHCHELQHLILLLPTQEFHRFCSTHHHKERFQGIPKNSALAFLVSFCL